MRSNPKYKKTSIPRRSKTIPIVGNKYIGDGIDDGKYYTCWYCGFTCNIDKDALAGSQSGDGLVLEEYSIPTYGGSSDPNTGIAALSGGTDYYQTALKNGSDGTPQTIINKMHESSSSTGCPQCHTLNWKGEYP